MKISFLERVLKEKSVRLEATSEPKDPRGDLTINRVNTVMQLWYRFVSILKTSIFRYIRTPTFLLRAERVLATSAAPHTDIHGIEIPLTPLVPRTPSSPFSSKSYAAGMKRLLSPWPFVSDSFEAGRYSPRSVIRFEFCKVDRGGGGGGAACGANRKFYYRDTRMTDTPATKQSGENSFLPRRVSFGWKETFDEEELCSGFVNSRILYTRSFRREKFLRLTPKRNYLCDRLSFRKFSKPLL